MLTKRDLKLTRDILLAIETDQTLHVSNQGLLLTMDGYSDDVVRYHVRLLAEGGYLLGCNAFHNGIPLVQGLTWKGHDFLDATRPKGIWDSLLAAAAKVGSMTLDVAVDIAKELAKQQLRAAAGIT